MSDGRVIIWTLDPAMWMRRACRRANRDFNQPVQGWTGPPLEPCSMLLKSTPSDEHAPDSEPDELPMPLPDNVATTTVAVFHPFTAYPSP